MIRFIGVAVTVVAAALLAYLATATSAGWWVVVGVVTAIAGIGVYDLAQRPVNDHLPRTQWRVPAHR